MIDKLRNIDRRLIYAFISLAVIIPLLFPIGFPIRTTSPVIKLHDLIETLPPGTKVLFSFDYDPATMPEVYPMNLALVDHCFSRDIKIVGMALWPMGVSLGQQVFETMSEKHNKEYGEDYVNLGYKAGGIVVISGASSNIRETFPEDYTGKNIDEFPIMEGVHNLDPFALIMSFSAGDPGVIQWVMIGHGRCHKEIGAGCTAVSAPSFYPYLGAGQLVGLLGGMKGAAEYETLMENEGLAVAGMDAQSVAHAGAS
jgi:hypothetical protein